MKSASARPVLLWTLVALMVLFWSGNYIAAKIALASLPALLAVALRITLAGIAILPFYYAQQRTPATRDAWKWREAPGLFALGVLGVTLNQLFFVVGVGLTSVAHAGIVIALTPLCVLLLAAAMGLERITVSGAFGMLVALAGVVYLQTDRAAAGLSHPTALGDAVVFLAALMFSLFTVFNKRIANLRSSMTINTFAYTGGAIGLVPLTVFEIAHHDVSRAPVEAWLAVVYMALFPSVFAYLIYSWALETVPASQIAALSYLQPLIATILAAMILHETVTTSLVWSGVLIFIGVAITERARSFTALETVGR